MTSAEPKQTVVADAEALRELRGGGSGGVWRECPSDHRPKSGAWVGLKRAQLVDDELCQPLLEFDLTAGLAVSVFFDKRSRNAQVDRILDVVNADAIKFSAHAVRLCGLKKAQRRAHREQLF
jgi:hypothetical protein